jgi:hypothetical protein
VARIAIRHGELIIEVEGINRIWALRSQLEIPLVHVAGAAVDLPMRPDRPIQSARGAAHESQVLDAATFIHDGDRVAWNVRDCARAIVITLDDARYPKLVVEVDDPDDAVARINSAVAALDRP